MTTEISVMYGSEKVNMAASPTHRYLLEFWKVMPLFKISLRRICLHSLVEINTCCNVPSYIVVDLTKAGFFFNIQGYLKEIPLY